MKWQTKRRENIAKKMENQKNVRKEKKEEERKTRKIGEKRGK